MLNSEKVTPSIIGIGTGNRNSSEPDRLKEFILNAATPQELKKMLQEQIVKYPLSNSEISLAFCLQAASKSFDSLDLFNLNQIFLTVEKKPYEKVQEKKLQMLMEKLDNARAICVSSPVHFGSTSSLAYRFFSLLSSYLPSKPLPLQMKICTSCTTSARRNGGTTTANLMNLYYMLQLGGIVIGNGPPVGQLGGACCARHPGDALSDNHGLQTCVNTGLNIGRIIRLINCPAPPEIHISICILSINNSHPENTINKISRAAGKIPNLSISHIDLGKVEFSRDKGCRRCPNPQAKNGLCIIEDDLTNVHQELINADIIVFCLDENKANQYDTNFDTLEILQRFFERTRCLRRSDFQLAEKIGIIFDFSSKTTSLKGIHFLSFFFKHCMIPLDWQEIPPDKEDENKSADRMIDSSLTNAVEIARKKRNYASPREQYKYGENLEIFI
jgi:multimeric flavodoxin WrbA